MLRPARQGSRRRRFAIPAAVAAAVTLALATAPPGSASAGSRSIYWGAEIGDQITGEKAPWDMRPVQRLQQIAGKGLSLVSFTAPFTECGGSGCRYLGFPTTPMDSIRSYGAIPVFGWSSNRTGGSAHDPAFRLSKVIHGTYDAYIRGFALEAREWGHPFFLRFDWEMNGFWFPWGAATNGNEPRQFVAAWRHVHDIFTAVGATNATWVWCPNIDLEGNLVPLRSLYPGNRYVDWTGIDGFNWGKRRGSPGWLSFDQVFSRTYGLIARHVAPRKPMMIAEVGSTARGAGQRGKAAWIRHMLRVIPRRYGKIHALSYYDTNDRGSGWPIETSGVVRRAFRRGIAQPAYQGNRFGSLRAHPIGPPR